MNFFKRLLPGAKSRATPAAQRNAAPPGTKMVWRISDSAPLGEWVDPASAAGTPSKPSRPTDETTDWTTSSMDLLSGMDVQEHTMNPPPGPAKAKKKRP